MTSQPNNQVQRDATSTTKTKYYLISDLMLVVEVFKP